MEAMAARSAASLLPSPILLPSPLYGRSSPPSWGSLARPSRAAASTQQLGGPARPSLQCHTLHHHHRCFHQTQPALTLALNPAPSRLSSSLARSSRSRRSAVVRCQTAEGGSSSSNGRQRSSQQQPYGVPDKGEEPEVWDVVGLGQAMVDFSAMVADDFLDSLDMDVPRGQRKVVDHEERGHVLRALDGKAYKLSAGGSLSNTLVALARLGAVPRPSPPVPAPPAPAAAAATSAAVAAALPVVAPGATEPGGVAAAGQKVGGAEERDGLVRVAMVGSVGSDPLGDFYRTKLLRANVHFLSQPIAGGTTGTVVVLTTPDAQRTMLSYQGMSSHVTCDAALEEAVGKARTLVVEGYLWELPQTVDAIAAACAVARSKGILVALTASDASCVIRHRAKFWDVMCRSAHVLFTNIVEARALAGCTAEPDTHPTDLALHLSRFCPFVSVTDGDRGSYLALRGREVAHIPAAPCAPVDTCGAGDAYAAGVLYGLMQGAPDLASLGRVGALVSAVVVGQQGARLREEDAAELVASLGFAPSSLAEGHVFHQMLGDDETVAYPPEGAGVLVSAEVE